MLVAAVSAYATIAFFVGLVTRVGMMPFVIYRVLLALIIILVFVYNKDIVNTDLLSFLTDATRLSMRWV